MRDSFGQSLDCPANLPNRSVERLVISTGDLSPSLVSQLYQANPSCSVTRTATGDLVFDGPRIFISWSVVRALLISRDLRPMALISEFMQDAHIFADDRGLTLVARDQSGHV